MSTVMDTSELRAELRRLKNILAVAKGNTHALESNIRLIEAELRRRERILNGNSE